MSKSYLNDITTKFRNSVIEDPAFQQFLITHINIVLKQAEFWAERGDYKHTYAIKLKDISSISKNNNIFEIEFCKQLSQQGFTISFVDNNENQYFTLDWS